MHPAQTHNRLRRAAQALALAFAIAASAGAAARDFLVDTTSDNGSAAFQSCDDSNATVDCSLRGALNAASAAAGPHNVRFDIPASDPGFQPATAHWRIDAASDLPLITRSMLIDGYTQPGASPNTIAAANGGSNAQLRIEVRGPGPSASTGGFYIGNGDAQATLRGLAISRFASNILIQSVGVQRVEGCFIGTDVAGNVGTAETAGRVGIRILVGTVFIGGTTPAARNVISGNPSMGIWASAATGLVTIQGNLIGTNAAGTVAIPGQDYGIFADTLPLGMLVGGRTPDSRNVIAGNEFGGVNRGVSSFPQNGVRSRIEGNRFGLSAAGSTAIPNGIPPSISARYPAVVAFGGGDCGVSIGGSEAGAENVIAHSGGPGVHIAACRNAPVIGNVFLRNRGLPIDLSVSSFSDGPTPNDAGDPDGSGDDPQVQAGNRLQNIVEILAQTIDTASDEIRLSLRVDSTTVAAVYPLRIDIHRDDALGTYPIATEMYPQSSAQQAVEVVLPYSLAGEQLAFTATDAQGNTSEMRRIGALFGNGFE